MTDKSISEQLLISVRLAAARASRELSIDPEKLTEEQTKWLEQIVVAYMTGCNQTANFLVRSDGDATPQQVERALALAGEQLGLTLTRPDHGKP